MNIQRLYIRSTGPDTIACGELATGDVGMQLLPFESYVIETDCLMAELVERLQSQTERPQFLRVALPHSEFVGWVSNDGFRIKPVIQSRASFVPEIFGRFVCQPGGTRVHVEMIPSSAALTILAVLTGSIGMMVFHSGTRVYLIIAGEILLAWLFSIVGFWLDAGASRRRMIEILHGPATIPSTTDDFNRHK